MALARSALLHLDSALRLFEDVSQNPRAIKVLVRLEGLLSVHDLTLASFLACAAEAKGTRRLDHVGATD